MSSFLTFIFNTTLAMLVVLSVLIGRGISHAKVAEEMNPPAEMAQGIDPLAILESPLPEQFLRAEADVDQHPEVPPPVRLGLEISEVYKMMSVWVQAQAQRLNVSDNYSRFTVPQDSRDSSVSNDTAFSSRPSEKGYRSERESQRKENVSKSGSSLPWQLNADDEPVVERHL